MTKVYSGGPNITATAAMTLDNNIKHKVPKVYPMVEESNAIFIAFLPFPCCAKGYPSNVVAKAAGVPGVLSIMAEIDPPNNAPLSIPKSIGIPTHIDMENVKGINSAI